MTLTVAFLRALDHGYTCNYLYCCVWDRVTAQDGVRAELGIPSIFG